ncbi:cysteine desulfurase/selenocysteine lyase [Natranaerovirga pectinivora]|uniref:Cysteine desulfurase/selenocysteine lyase n=2 Tax=Natranaerovirga pectinivora TaxID=682400 RepID=A0A4R3MMC6_9FIRM|nr:cysteine desulfurase/selenocysteine lyase [Natranaerovirga pectinivora]
MNSCANIGRGSYEWANKNHMAINDVRKKVASFINGKSINEIVFTSGATESSNLIVYSWALHNLKDGDEVLLCYTDHKSTVLPWINIKELLYKSGVTINLVPIINNSQGDYNEIDLYSKINDKTQVVVLTHIHNAYGMEMGVQEIVKKIKTIKEDTVFVLDVSQSIGHIKIDTEALGIDFLYFSGHKMFAGNGVGVLWINSRLHHQIKPFFVGGNSRFFNDEIIRDYNKGYEMLEAGTMNIPSILTLEPAIQLINEIGIEVIEGYLLELTQYLIKELKKISKVQFVSGPPLCSCVIGYGIISFKIDGVSSQDIGYILNDYGIFVRTGQHCISNEGSIDHSVRVSLQIYNTVEEIDKFISIIKIIAEVDDF